MLKNNKAASLLEVIMSVVIVGFTAATLLQLQSVQNHLSKKNQLLVDAKPNTKLLMLRVKNLISEVQSEAVDSVGSIVNDKGVCAFIDTQASSPGVAQINFKFTQSKIDSVFSASRWRQAIGSAYKLYTKGAQCRGTNFTKCYVSKKDKDLIYQIKIKPLLLKIKDSNYLDLKIQSKTAPSVIDFKTVFFKIKVTPFSLSSSGIKKKYRTVSSLLWSGDIPYCSKFFGGIYLKLYISGTGIATKNAIYNTSIFDDTGDKNPLEIIFSESVIQAGSTKDGLLVVNPNLNISTSMIKEKYSCVSLSGNQVAVPPKETTISSIRLSLKYIKQANTPSKILLKFDQSFAFVRAGVLTNKLTDVQFDRKKRMASSISAYPHFSINLGGANIPYVKASDGFFYEAEYDNRGDKTLMGYCPKRQNINANFSGIGCKILLRSSKPFFLSAGLVNINLVFLQHANSNSALSHCFSGGPVQTYKLTINSHHPITKQLLFTSKAQKNPYMGCTICYMKNCKRLGLKTFGPMYNSFQQVKPDLPLEPLDSALPECSNYTSVFKKSSENKPIFSFYEMLFKKGILTNPEKCLSYTPSSNFSTTGTLSEASCSEPKYPLCSAFGGRYRGRELSPFAQSSNTCYQLGKETVNRTSITQLINSTNGSCNGSTNSNCPLPTSVTNLSQAGLFLFTPNFLTYSESRSATGVLSFSEFIQRNKNKYQFSTAESVDDVFLPYQTINKKSGEEVGKESSYPKYWAHSILKFQDKTGWANPVFYWKASETSIGQFQVKTFSNRLGQKRSTIRWNERKSASGERAGLLINSIRGKGLLWGNPVQTLSFAFLCWKQESVGQYSLFRSDEVNRRLNKSSNAKSTNWSDGERVCQDRGGQFFPLFTGRQWVEALHLAGKHSENYTFPDPDSVTLKPLWLAFSKKNNNINLYDTNVSGFDAFKAHSVIKSMPTFSFTSDGSGGNSENGKFKYNPINIPKWSLFTESSAYYFYKKNTNDADVKNASPYLLYSNKPSLNSVVSVSLLNTWLMKIYLFYAMFNPFTGEVKLQYKNRGIEFFATANNSNTPSESSPPPGQK